MGENNDFRIRNNVGDIFIQIFFYSKKQKFKVTKRVSIILHLEGKQKKLNDF